MLVKFKNLIIKPFKFLKKQAPEFLMVLGAVMLVIPLFMIDIKWGLLGAGLTCVIFSFLVGGD